MKNTTTPRFYWDPETLEHFKAVAECDTNNTELYEEVKKFVHKECQLEEGEQYSDLIFDLLQQIK